MKQSMIARLHADFEALVKVAAEAQVERRGRGAREGHDGDPACDQAAKIIPRREIR